MKEAPIFNAERPEKTPVDFDTLRVGMEINIKQPNTTAYSTGADADATIGGMELDESWISAVIIDISTNPDNQYVTVSKKIQIGSHFVEDFGPHEMWYQDGVLYAEFRLVD